MVKGVVIAVALIATGSPALAQQTVRILTPTTGGMAPDATLIAPKGDETALRKLVALLEERGFGGFL